MRHFPYAFTRWAMRRVGRDRAAMVYLHPYELDTQPGPDWLEPELASADKRTRRFHRLQLRNRGTVRPKLERMLGDFVFAPLNEVIDAEPASAPSARNA